MTSRIVALVKEARGLTATRTQELLAAIVRFPASIRNYPAPFYYASSVAFEKGVSLITLPLMAIYLSPAEYGSYDVAVSIVELVYIVMSLGAASSVLRFASTAGKEQDSQFAVRDLLGSSVCVTIAIGSAIVAFAPLATNALGVATDPISFRVLIAAAVVAPCIEIPMIWIRLKERARLFFNLVVARSLAQLLLTFVALHFGHGVPGVMAANGICMLAYALLLLVLQIRQTGIGISRTAFYRILVYGLPIVGAALCLFALGSANRLFLPGTVSTEVIGHFGLASRIAMIVWLLLYPFDLWWGPHRISSLSAAGGLELGARMWGVGFALLLLSGVALALLAPVAVLALLPASYAPAIAYITPLIAAQILHQTANLTNVGSLAREHGFSVLAIDASGAAIAILGYLVLVPQLAITGVLISLLLGSGLRVLLHFWIGRERAPLPYPWVAALLSMLAGAILVLAAPAGHQYVWRTIYAGLAISVLFAVIVVTGLIKFSGGAAHGSR